MSQRLVKAEIDWKIGVEVELVAPAPGTRRDLAEAYAAAAGGSVRTFFHPQSELSKVPGKPVFHNLTLGFEARDAEGRRIALCVDDPTLQVDFDRHAAPRSGWYRIVGDDQRLLRLIARHADASKGLPGALEGVVEFFGAKLHPSEGGMFRMVDEVGAPICIGAPLPGERERPCEVVTPPLEADHGRRLDDLLEMARGLGFTVASEAATHLHFDAGPLCSARTVAHLVEILSAHGQNLRRLLETNPANRRVGGWPPALLELVRRPNFLSSPWETARERLAALQASKYCDFNLKNMAHAIESKHTFEVRVLPGTIEAEPILAAAGLFEAILLRAMHDEPVASSQGSGSWTETTSFLDGLPMQADLSGYWRQRIGSASADFLR